MDLWFESGGVVRVEGNSRSTCDPGSEISTREARGDAFHYRPRARSRMESKDGNPAEPAREDPIQEDGLLRLVALLSRSHGPPALRGRRLMPPLRVSWPGTNAESPIPRGAL
jgi:hypothetical protein